MKGFPNQVADLSKLSVGILTLINLVDNGQNVRDDGLLGKALVYAGVAGTGHVPVDREIYIQQQEGKRKSDQSFRTTARGLRELYKLLGFIEDDDSRIHPTELGRNAAALARAPLDAERLRFWRKAIIDLDHFGGDVQSSHPYQVLLRLIGQRPGISRAKCALALEARNDSSEELNRITQLSFLDEGEIIRCIGVTESNWNNAKKVLPKFAEQLGDVIKEDGTFRLAPVAGCGIERYQPSVSVTNALKSDQSPIDRTVTVHSRGPSGSRCVTPNTIGRAGTADDFGDVYVPSVGDPDTIAIAINLRRQRLRRHNLVVKELALKLKGFELFEDPFDVLAIGKEHALLIEVKTLDGSDPDERDRVREALSQLLYYEAFVTTPFLRQITLSKIACFESEISDAHKLWLNESEIGVIWKVTDGSFRGDKLALRSMGKIIG